jgi:hypothetical protein
LQSVDSCGGVSETEAPDSDCGAGAALHSGLAVGNRFTQVRSEVPRRRAALRWRAAGQGERPGGGAAGDHGHGLDSADVDVDMDADDV